MVFVFATRNRAGHQCRTTFGGGRVAGTISSIRKAKSFPDGYPYVYGVYLLDSLHSLGRKFIHHIAAAKILPRFNCFVM